MRTDVAVGRGVSTGSERPTAADIALQLQTKYGIDTYFWAGVQHAASNDQTNVSLLLHAQQQAAQRPGGGIVIVQPPILLQQV
jgi:hypothetical protein